MFRLYLECGSVGALAEELGRRNIASKARTFASGRSKGGRRYSVGALAHFLKNRFYVGDVAYRGEIHAGEHEPILDRATFDAVREVIGERVRDKIAASKRKGIWVGGPIPLGYASVGKKLVIVPEEAETVRTMFRLYL